MKLTQIMVDGATHLCLLAPDGRLVDLNLTADKTGLPLPRSMAEAIERAEELPELMDRALKAPAMAAMAEDPVRYAPVVSKYGKIICVGTNYRKHLIECGMPFPKAPVIFGKFSNALAAHGQAIEMPMASEQIDYEAELVIVIGKGGKHIAREDALQHVFGYTCGNDLSARDLQMLSGQWMIGKTLDGFAPVGPFIATKEGIDPDRLDIGTKVNGETRQAANTSDMIFDCATLIGYISDIVTLEPGDLIFTGTPDGVILGYPEAERVWLKAGDVAEVTIEGLGTLRNRLA